MRRNIWVQLFWRMTRKRVFEMIRVLNSSVDIEALMDGWIRMARFTRCLHPMRIANCVLPGMKGIAGMAAMGREAVEWNRWGGSDC